ncbi:MAG: XdhC family protein [Nakamurella multipartita]
MGRQDLDERAAQLRTAGVPFVRARVVLARRPTSARAGDEAIVHADGSIEGFVGGTCAESTVRVQSLRLLGRPEPLLLRIVPDDVGRGDGEAGPAGTLTVHNPCLSGGALEIFLDPVVPAPLVLVHGDGPVAQALRQVTEAAGYRCAEAAAQTVPGADAVVVASHGRDETAVLAAAIEAGVGYIGLIASRRRGAAVLAEIAAARPDLAEQLPGRVDTPAGLDLGARTAGEIAVSVLAAIVHSRAHPPARINFAGADETAPNGAGETEVNDLSRAGIHSGGGDTRADETAPNVNGGTEVADFGRAGEVDPREGRGEAVDPVCGMTVATVPASERAEYDGRTVWFCGPGCRNAFLADPTRYPES